MEITNVRVSLDGASGKLLAFCTFCIDDAIVVKNVKIVSRQGGRFIAMPNDAYKTKCLTCGRRVPVNDFFCGRCGARQPDGRAPVDDDGRELHYSDVCHPVTSACRRMIEDAVFAAYDKALLEEPHG